MEREIGIKRGREKEKKNKTVRELNNIGLRNSWVI